MIGTSDGCAIASYVKGDHILAVQAHPEFNDRFMRAVLEYSKASMPADVYLAAEASLATATDGARFAEWIAAFLTWRKGHA